MKEFPNGFESWQETHYEVVSFIADELTRPQVRGIVYETLREKGHGGLYELAEDLTDEYEQLNKGREWDGEFFEELESFLNQKLY